MVSVGSHVTKFVALRRPGIHVGASGPQSEGWRWLSRSTKVPCYDVCGRRSILTAGGSEHVVAQSVQGSDCAVASTTLIKHAWCMELCPCAWTMRVSRGQVGGCPRRKDGR